MTSVAATFAAMGKFKEAQKLKKVPMTVTPDEPPMGFDPMPTERRLQAMFDRIGAAWQHSAFCNT